MIRHIVLWKFQESAGGADRDSNLATASRLLKELPGRIPSIRSFEVGVDTGHGPQAYDLALNSTFDSEEGLHAYIEHPAHRQVVVFLRAVQSGRVVADYEI